MAKKDIKSPGRAKTKKSFKKGTSKKAKTRKSSQAKKSIAKAKSSKAENQLKKNSISIQKAKAKKRKREIKKPAQEQYFGKDTSQKNIPQENISLQPDPAKASGKKHLSLQDWNNIKKDEIRDNKYSRRPEAYSKRGRSTGPRATIPTN